MKHYSIVTISTFLEPPFLNFLKIENYLVNSTSTSETDAFMAQEGNFMVSSDEIYVYF